MNKKMMKRALTLAAFGLLMAGGYGPRARRSFQSAG